MTARRRAVAAVVALAAFAAVAFVLEVILGLKNIPLRSFFLVMTGNSEDVPHVDVNIIVNLRLPRAIMACCVGALLASSGTLLQGFLRNPLAEPYLLGVSSGAALAVTAVILLSMPLFVFGVYIVPVAAFGGALATLVIVYLLAEARGRMQVTTLVLAGVVVSAFLSSLIMLLASLNIEHYHEVLSWLLGHLQPLERNAELWIGAYTLVGLAAALAQSRDLNALLLGEEKAASLGVDVESVKRTLFVLSSLLAGVAVSASGLIGFIGLVAPHFSRLLLGPDHRWLIPAAALSGAALLLLADLAARLVLAPTELPVGVVTALVGGPFFLYLLMRHSRQLGGRRR